ARHVRLTHFLFHSFFSSIYHSLSLLSRSLFLSVCLSLSLSLFLSVCLSLSFFCVCLFFASSLSSSFLSPFFFSLSFCLSLSLSLLSLFFCLSLSLFLSLSDLVYPLLSPLNPNVYILKGPLRQTVCE